MDHSKNEGKERRIKKHNKRRMKYYYSPEFCDYICDLEGFKIILGEDDLEEIELEEMKRVKYLTINNK